MTIPLPTARVGHPHDTLSELVDQVLADEPAPDEQSLLDLTRSAASRLASRIDRTHTDEQALFDLAIGLAILARRPGGVHWFGRHWCAEVHEGCPGAATAPADGRTPAGSCRSLTGSTVS